MASSDDRQRIESYLRGEETAAREVDSWIRREIEIRYPDMRHEMDDICQAVHGKLVENLRTSKFQYRSTLKTYVGRIAQHTAVDSIRKRYRERAVTTDWVLESATSGETAQNSLEALERQVLVDQLLLHSSGTCRDLWRLVFLEGLSYTEIGTRLSIPAGTVKSRMWHCRRRALALLEQLQRKSARRAAVPPGDK